DNELDEQWKPVIEAHLEDCISCQQKLAGFGSLRTVLLGNDEAGSENRQSSNWRVLQKHIVYGFPRPFWKRKFQIPMPVFAAMALVVLTLSIGLILSLNDPSGISPFADAAKPNLAESELQSVEDILNFLDARGEGYSVTIELPQNTKFQILSEPKLIRAADYNRGR
ncbi:MAG: hypothetical protein HN368_11710, partial [Spirochaetales bacterium]|nr:hypothetical protein [Spirochaetales bacterium]